jgi:hypothetical protein
MARRQVGLFDAQRCTGSIGRIGKRIQMQRRKNAPITLSGCTVSARFRRSTGRAGRRCAGFARW